MQQGRSDQPRHEAGVLDRVPEPPAAPAQLVIGPEAAEPDADRQEGPAGQGPGPHPSPPRGPEAGVGPPLDQGRHGQRETDRQPDIARIEQRRMEGQGRVLQQRVQGGEHRKGDEHHPQRPLGGDRTGLQPERQAPCPRQHRAEPGQDQAPQHQRAFVAAPGPGHLVEHRLVGVAVRRDIGDREVRDHEGEDQDRKGKTHGQGRRQGRALCRTGQDRTAPHPPRNGEPGLQY
jgi:hypothetical protein